MSLALSCVGLPMTCLLLVSCPICVSGSSCQTKKCPGNCRKKRRAEHDETIQRMESSQQRQRKAKTRTKIWRRPLSWRIEVAEMTLPSTGGSWEGNAGRSPHRGCSSWNPIFGRSERMLLRRRDCFSVRSRLSQKNECVFRVGRDTGYSHAGGCGVDSRAWECKGESRADGCAPRYWGFP